MEGSEHSDGDLAEYVLEAGQQMIVDTGYMAGFEESVSIDIQSVQGVKNVVFGRKRFFNTVFSNPRRICIPG